MTFPNIDVFLAPNGGCLPVLQLRRLILRIALKGGFDDRQTSSISIDNFAGEIFSSCAIRRQKNQRGKSQSVNDPIRDDEKPLAYVDHAYFARLRDITEIRKGPTGIKDAVAGPYPLVVTAEARSSCDHYDFDAKAVLIPMVSSTGHGDASLKRIHYQEGKFAVGSILCAVLPNHPTQIYARYLYEYLAAFKEELLVSRMVGTANVSLTVSKVSEIPVPLATPHAQRRVEELMTLCDELEARGRLADEQHARLTSTLFDALAASDSAQTLADNWQRIATYFDLLLDRPQAIDALEQTILQLAVRGLLVPQDASDEPASDLLTRLRAERDQMVAAGEIRRGKILPPLSNKDEPFGLPSGWGLARLGELANFIDYRGRTPVKTPSGIPLITAKNVRQGRINREPREFIAENAYAGWMTRGLPRSGDLLFTTEAPLGNVASVDIGERFALAQRVICFALYEREMSGALKIFLMSRWFQSELVTQATGVTAQGIKSARLQLLPIPIPPLAEQHRIVARVEHLRRLCDDLRERLNKVRATQTHLAETLVTEVVQPHRKVRLG